MRPSLVITGGITYLRALQDVPGSWAMTAHVRVITRGVEYSSLATWIESVVKPRLPHTSAEQKIEII